VKERAGGKTKHCQEKKGRKKKKAKDHPIGRGKRRTHEAE